MTSQSDSGASQLLFEAREAGIEEVCRLLQAPEDLARLPGLRAENDAKRAANKTQLTALVQSHVEATRSGMELLDRSQKTVLKLRAGFEQIDRLCNECTSLIENHEKIQMLSVTHHNVTKTLEEIDNIIKLPDDAELAEEMLEDDAKLVDAYSALTALEGTSKLVQDAMTDNHRRRDEMQNLNEYFDKVKDTYKKLEERLWSNFHNYDVLGLSNPGLLVGCVRVVETQEMVDKELKEPKAWKRQALKCMEDSIRSKFSTIVVKCKELDPPASASDGEEADVQNPPVLESIVPEILDQATKLSEELAGTYDYVAPCFPPDYDVFRTLWSRYHLNFASVVDSLGLRASRIANRDILGVIRWVEAYQETLRGLGLEEEELRMPKYPVLTSSSSGAVHMERSGMGLLIEKYVDRIRESSTTMYLNIIESDIAGEPEVNEDGMLWSPGVVDFFRMLNDSLATVEDVTQGEMMYESAKLALAMMKEFINAQVAVLQREISFGMLCAFANNNVKCYDMSIDFVEHVEEAIDEEYKNTLEVEEVCRGFLDVGKLAMKKVTEGMFSDPGMVDLLKKLYQGVEWVEGRVTATFIATILDYFADLKEFLEPSIFRRVVESTLDMSMSAFTSALMSKIPPITEVVLERMKADEEELTEFYKKYMKADKVEAIIQKLTNLRTLACSSDTEAFLLSYLAILDSDVNTQPIIVERICNARQDMTKQDAAEVVEQCKDMYVQRQKTVAAENHAQAKHPQTPTSSIWQRWREMWES
ncbi:hypothetical protein BSKO_09466 [Bryopsis sp. KO-2023]|nr:hypothetical protein BSKO_09466 [Bryopsis sp. KO-2023]